MARKYPTIQSPHMVSWGAPPEIFESSKPYEEPSLLLIGEDSFDWETQLAACDNLERTGHFSMVTFEGVLPVKIEHIGRCKKCWRYERLWLLAQFSRCPCWTTE